MPRLRIGNLTESLNHLLQRRLVSRALRMGVTDQLPVDSVRVDVRAETQLATRQFVVCARLVKDWRGNNEATPWVDVRINQETIEDVRDTASLYADIADDLFALLEQYVRLETTPSFTTRLQLVVGHDEHIVAHNASMTIPVDRYRAPPTETKKAQAIVLEELRAENKRLTEEYNALLAQLGASTVGRTRPALRRAVLQTFAGGSHGGKTKRT